MRDFITLANTPIKASYTQVHWAWSSSEHLIGEVIKLPWAVTIAIASLSLRPFKDKLLNTLRQDSDVLEAQREDFAGISTEMDVICVYEEMKTDGVLVSTFASIDEYLPILYPRQHQVVRGCTVSHLFLT